jgi:glycerol-3-phosphate dehydrogenase (NAD(P)+)
MQRIGIMGAGAWGSALAIAAARAGRAVILQGRDPQAMRAMAEQRENRRRLPGVRLPEAVEPTGEIERLGDCEAILLVVPAQVLRAALDTLAPHLPTETPLVICAKGIERSSGALMSEIVSERFSKQPQAVLSGPTFATEVGRGLPTAVSLASRDPALADDLVAALGSRTFRPYSADDPIGIEIGGAVKNVVAIACGIVTGRELGENARASLITRGLAEITRLALAKGGRAQSLMGLGGLGDLTLSCTSTQSRNYAHGLALGRRQDAPAGDDKPLTEGVATAAAVVALARRLGIEMPICEAVNAVLHGGETIEEAIELLLSRPFKAELS